MKKPIANRRPAARHQQPASCPVLPIAVRVGQLWDAHAMAEEREGGLSDTPKQIDLLRMATEEMASFERARSVAGALFQVGLAEDAAVHLRDLDLSEERTVRKTFDKLIRLLDSVSLLLREECPPEDYETVKDVIGAYLTIGREGFDPPFQWREDIPELAREYRAKPAEKAEA